MSENKKPKFFYGYIIVLVGFIILVVMEGTFVSFGVFFESLLTEFGWTRAMTSGAFSLSMILIGLLMVVTGRLTDKFGPRIITTVGGISLGLGYLLMSQVSAIWQLYLFYGVMIAVGLSGGYIPLVATVSRWFVKRRGMMAGIVLAGIDAGIMIMPPLITWLISSYGWRTSYILIGSVVLVIIIAAAQFLRRDPGQIGQLPYGAGEVNEQKSDWEGRGFSLREAMCTRQFWILFTAWLCHGFLAFTIMVHIVLHAIGLGISATSAATVLSIMGMLSIGGRVMLGGAGDRIGYKQALIIGFGLMSVAFFELIIAKELWMLYLFTAIFGFGFGGSDTLFTPMTAKLFGLVSLGVISGALVFGFTIGGAIGPVLAGYIFDVTGSYQLAFLICIAVSIIGIILVLLLKPISSEEG